MKKYTFDQVVEDCTSKFHKIKKEDYSPTGQYKIVDQGKEFIAGYTNDKELVNTLSSPIIIFGDHTKIFKYVDFPLALGADGAKALTIKNNLADSKYLYYYFRTLKLTDAGYSRHFKFLKEVSIPLPENFDDQIRIAAVLTRAEKLIAKRKESIKAMDDLLNSIFMEMFGDPVRNEKGWEKKRIDEIAEVKIGPFGSLLHSEDYVDNEIPLINPSHIIDGEIVPDYKLTITSEKFKELETYQLKINDVVVARRGEIGRCAIVRTSKPLFCGTGSMFIRIFCNYYPLLLQHQIYNTSLKAYLESKAKGVTMKNLNSTTLGNLQVLYPPLPLQNKFAAIVEKVEVLKSKYTQSLTELENLYGSMSQRAFKGKLDLSKVLVDVVQIPKYEASSNLLNEADTEVKIEESRAFDIDYVNNTIIDDLKGLFTYQELKKTIVDAHFKRKPEPEEVQKVLIYLLETRFIEQVFIPPSSQPIDQIKKQIRFRVIEK